MTSKSLNFKMKLGIIFIALAINVFAGGVTKNVILFIGDGMGMSAIDLSRMLVVGKENLLEFEKAPVIGIQKTYSANVLVTDSAAAGTALATGNKTNNAAIGVDAGGKTVKNLIEASKEKGKATGVITTVTITHATPAVFGGHTLSRDELPISDEYAKYKSADIYMGGGREYFIPKSSAGSLRQDERNLISEFSESGYKYISTRQELLETEDGKILGLFEMDYIPFVIDREYFKSEAPTLAEMTKKALSILSKNDNGFFVMIEAGKIDWAAHENDAGSLVKEVGELNEAVKEALEFLKSNPDTIIIVTADHETGGIGMSTGDYSLNPEMLRSQKISAREMTKLLYKKGAVEVRDVLKKYAGIDKMIKKDVDSIMKFYEVADVGRYIGSEAQIGFTTMAHSGQSVPVYVFGKNSEKFAGVYENVEIAKKIAEISGVELGK